MKRKEVTEKAVEDFGTYLTDVQWLCHYAKRDCDGKAHRNRRKTLKLIFDHLYESLAASLPDADMSREHDVAIMICTTGVVRGSGRHRVQVVSIVARDTSVVVGQQPKELNRDPIESVFPLNTPDCLEKVHNHVVNLVLTNYLPPKHRRIVNKILAKDFPTRKSPA